MYFFDADNDELNAYFGNIGYPLYRRISAENSGKLVKIQLRNFDIEVDKCCVIPYAYLLSKCFTHVEYCNSVNSIKYMCKYVNKCGVMAVFGMQPERNDRNPVTYTNKIA